MSSWFSNKKSLIMNILSSSKFLENFVKRNTTLPELRLRNKVTTWVCGMPECYSHLINTVYTPQENSDTNLTSIIPSDTTPFSRWAMESVLIAFSGPVEQETISETSSPFELTYQLGCLAFSLRFWPKILQSLLATFQPQIGLFL